MDLRIVGVALVFALAVACGGEDGKDGEDGVSWLTAAVPASSADCPGGGTTVQVGPDSNRNGALDTAEVASASNVCNGTDGDPSDLWLVATEEADTDRCAWGGTIVHTGKDADGSEVLEPAEFLATQPICKSPVRAGGREVSFTGAGADNRMTNVANWLDANAPYEGDVVVFPVDAARKRIDNDYPLMSTFAGLYLRPGIELFGKKLGVLSEIVGQAEDANGCRIEQAVALRGAAVGITVLHSGSSLSGLTITGAIEGSSNVTKYGAGPLYLEGNNTYRGTTYLEAGILVLAGGNAIPDTSAFTCDSSSELAITVSGETLANLDGDCSVSLAGALTLASDADMTFSGAMVGTGAVIKRGSGFLALTGDGSTHTGTLLIEGGSVFINNDYGATPVNVGTGTTLSGNGNPGAITVASGGRVEPGVPGTAILTSSGNITLAAGSTLAVKLNGTVSGTGYDRLAANGDVALAGATLAVDIGFTAADGNTFTIVQCTGALTGTFAGLPHNTALQIEGQPFVIEYTANSARLRRVAL